MNASWGPLDYGPANRQGVEPQYSGFLGSSFSEPYLVLFLPDSDTSTIALIEVKHPRRSQHDLNDEVLPFIRDYLDGTRPLRHLLPDAVLGNRRWNFANTYYLTNALDRSLTSEEPHLVVRSAILDETTDSQVNDAIDQLKLYASRATRQASEASLSHLRTFLPRRTSSRTQRVTPEVSDEPIIAPETDKHDAETWLTIASAHFGPTMGRAWFEGSNSHLGGARPVDVLRSGNTDAVFEALTAMITGEYA